MDKRVITDETVSEFREEMILDEKSPLTIEKYIRDIDCFRGFINGSPLSKSSVIEYKQHLISKGYAVSSINSMLSSLNSLFTLLGWHDLRVRTIKVQKKIYCPEETELTRSEYERLVNAAEKKGDMRLSLVIQTICSTGIRVSELSYITVEAVRKGEANVSLKGKNRTVFIVSTLRKKLLKYVMANNIKSGPVFVTRTGSPLSRTNIWKAMKDLCELADVSPGKVFPHNLRHLFARIFYGLERDIAKLADILGHSSINTTRIYIISSGSEHRRCLEKMKLVI